MVWPSDKCPPEAAHSASTGGWASLLLTEAAAATLDRCRELEAVTLWDRAGMQSPIYVFQISKFSDCQVLSDSLEDQAVR